jgi:hypothetical protein
MSAGPHGYVRVAQLLGRVGKAAWTDREWLSHGVDIERCPRRGPCDHHALIVPGNRGGAGIRFRERKGRSDAA